MDDQRLEICEIPSVSSLSNERVYIILLQLLSIKGLSSNWMPQLLMLTKNDILFGGQVAFVLEQIYRSFFVVLS